ncbi:hypothetical protein SCOCK_60200 [Actinacidiphila cocklensis]|uniref:Uncharacterized protein n=1 Tax=Actinacidiphila cocklensis TaxID=887465 RepID=A0A9W4DWU7_9ACTN|nr:hypothetical protein SCOCK_60200 [Actinacidiphila cocklensis]
MALLCPFFPVVWHGYGTRPTNWSRQQLSPKPMTWGFAMERMTGIEPAL